MALDSRIAAGASNCGFDTFRIDGNTFRWSHATGCCPGWDFLQAAHTLLWTPIAPCRIPRSFGLLSTCIRCSP
jgi:hypothetical protein